MSAAYALTLKKLRVLVVDRGKHIYERQRNDAYDVANGIGGAGLFSDGKLSMYPAATNLWKLNKDDLREAYNDIHVLLAQLGVDIEEFSEEWTKETLKYGVHKNYKSAPMNIEQRMKLIFKFYQLIGDNNIMVESNITKIEKANSLYHIDINNKYANNIKAMRESTKVPHSLTRSKLISDYGSFGSKKVTNTQSA